MSVTIRSNSSEIAADLGRQSGRVTRRMIAVVREAGVDMRDEWRANATETAGAHGKHYPGRIQNHATGVLEQTIYPEGRPQGDMSFEFGSRNQPPHLDGQRALDALSARIQRRIDAALVF